MGFFGSLNLLGGLAFSLNKDCHGFVVTGGCF